MTSYAGSTLHHRRSHKVACVASALTKEADATVGKLPDDTYEITKLIRQGKTQKEIAEMFGVTRQAVSYRMREPEGTPGRRTWRSHDEFFPWRIESAHKTTSPHRKVYRRCIELHTLLEGWPQTAEGRQMAEAFQRVLAGENSRGVPLVVDYDPDTGFRLKPAKPGDGPVFAGSR